MATPSISSKNVPSKIKCESLVARYKGSLNSDLPQSSMISDYLKSSFVQISMVPSKCMLGIGNLHPNYM